METLCDRQTSDTRSGGKIVMNRRVPAVSRNPYARPEKLPEQRGPIDENHEIENPNWLSGLVYPAKVIASGAGKILSFFVPDDSSSSSDSESSKNDEEEDEIENEVSFQQDDQEEDEIENEVSFQQDDQSVKVLSLSGKTDKKLVIEQLVMQETFSREEGNELIKLIKSRVVDADGNADENAANMRTAAIMEARKWLEQKRSGSTEKINNEPDVTNWAMPSQVTRSVNGSPIDMAKSYMLNRPAWASPTSLNPSEFGSPSRLGILHFKEETPRSTLSSFEMKGTSLSSGSWNILEEMQRVRSKSTEELVAATPLTKTRLSSSSHERDPPQHSSMDVEREAPADSTHIRPHNFLLDASTSLPSRINQGGDAVQSTEPQEYPYGADLKSNDGDKVNASWTAAAENGFLSTVSSLAAEQVATLSLRPSKEENGNGVGSSQAGLDFHMEDLHVNPPDDVVNGSQNNQSIGPGELSQGPSQAIEEQSSMTVAKDFQRRRKPRGVYTRRGRGRGR